MLGVFLHRANIRFGQRKPLIVEIIGRADDEIRTGSLAQIFIHIEAADEGIKQVQQHNRQGQRSDDEHSLPAAPSQIGEGHRKGRHPAGGTGLFAGLSGLGVFHGFDRGHAARDPARAGTGEQDGQQGKDRRTQKNDRGDADRGVFSAQNRGGEGDGYGQNADAVAQQQSQRDARRAEHQRLLADDPAKLLRRDADGLEQAVKADVSGHRDLKNVVDDQIAGENHQNEHRRDRQNGVCIHDAGKLGGGIAPVDADAELPGLFTDCVATVLRDLCELFLNMQGAAQHHAQVGAEGVHALRHCLRFHLLRIVARNVEEVHSQQLVIFPVAHQRKGVGDLAAHLVFVRQRVGQGHLGAQLGCNAQQGKGFGVHCDFFSCFRRPADRREGIAPPGVVVIHEADLTVLLGKDARGAKADDRPFARRLDPGMGGQGLDLRLVHILERAVAVAADAAELVVLVCFIDGQDNGEQGRKEQRRQRNRGDGDQVPLAGGPQGFAAQAADAASIFHLHDSRLLSSARRSGRPRCG